MTKGSRIAYADNLKVVLVAGVVVAHVVIAWTHIGVWVTEEPPVRDPLFSILAFFVLLGAFIGMPLFFFVAGLFTPGSLERKGSGRFVRDRAVRLLVPMVLFVLLISPPIEYVDDSNAGWTGSFWAFVPWIWSRVTPGPTWFLGVLFLFSVTYAAYRAARPRRHPDRRTPLSLPPLVVTATLMVPASFAIRLGVPLGEEFWRLAVGQAPAWLAGFVLGVLAGEQGWLRPLEPGMARVVRYAAWLGGAAAVGIVGVGLVSGLGPDPFLGGGTWQSLLLAVFEAVFVVAGCIWLVDVFRRRFDRQGPLARELGRAAYATFFIHQLVLVGVVLAVRQVVWAPEVEFVVAAVLGLVVSFGVGLALVRVPGVRRLL